jgi:hypothetical protein
VLEARRQYAGQLLYKKLNQHFRYSEAMPWHKGQSGNPGGLTKGARRKLSDVFIRTFARDWEAHGEEVIRRVREEDSAVYFKGDLASLRCQRMSRPQGKGRYSILAAQDVTKCSASTISGGETPFADTSKGVCFFRVPLNFCANDVQR